MELKDVKSEIKELNQTFQGVLRELEKIKSEIKQGDFAINFDRISDQLDTRNSVGFAAKVLELLKRA